MLQKFNRWLRTKTGKISMAVVIVAGLSVAFIGGQLGWFAGPGAAGVGPDPATCGLVATTYNVENPASVPFYGIKYLWTGGQVVKSGAADTFSYSLPTAVVQGLTSVTIQAKANPYTGQVVLDGCNFSGNLACNTPKLDSTKRFSFQFLGAQDNGDGTLKLNFYVQVIVTRALTHVAISLPNGVVASSPAGTYSGQTCPTP